MTVDPKDVTLTWGGKPLPKDDERMKRCHVCGQEYTATPRPRNEGWRATCDECRKIPSDG